MLTLYEELLLLTIHEDKGIYIGSTTDALKPGLPGAILAELALAGKICTSNNRRLQLEDPSPTNDLVIDDALDALKNTEKDRKFGYWINNLIPKPEKLRKQITLSLVEKGILTQEDENLAWVIPSPMHPEIKASLKYAVIQHLRSIVLTKEPAGGREIAFLSLVSACGLLDLVFLRDERKVATQYINELLVGEAMKDPNLETIQEIASVIASVVEED